MAAQTLKNYDASSGAAFKIYVKNASDVVVTNTQDVDVTAQLIAANILVGTEQGADAVVDVFGSLWADVARYALDIKTPEDAPL